MLGFYVASSHLYGLPERADKMLLKITEASDPYRCFSLDLFPHDEWSMQSLYSGIPYLTGHSADHDESIMWINAAETWVDIMKPSDKT